ncbi:VOC family protein [Mucilaginibacter sp. X4EP1]|uniref:VOC family protein n=1 Tax=Mucilaginibacter sp. X4EP1 TaxID=2723092 RepID=UPI002169AB3B|nr:VOC family protein [Mucilaginibacter sp. X4EP1]MCS3813771.1 catechol 2,3-dioxygenase-like lactoylglutathione lyase family enzyme [Mucilaginibacter sp. X4EP1]
MKLRIARYTTNLNRMIDFYGRILGLKILGEFKDHQQYDGVFLGIPGESWHLEFTVSGHPPLHQPDADDLLVFYTATVNEFTALKNKLIANGVKNVPPTNPYWAKNGITFQDPDGFRIVISIAIN